MNFFDLIAIDIFYEIIYRLLWFERINCSLVCKSWAKRLSIDSIWKNWILKDENLKVESNPSNYKKWIINQCGGKKMLHESSFWRESIENLEYLKEHFDLIKKCIIMTVAQFTLIKNIVLKSGVDSVLKVYPLNNFIEYKNGSDTLQIQVAYISPDFPYYKIHITKSICEKVLNILKGCLFDRESTFHKCLVILGESVSYFGKRSFADGSARFTGELYLKERAKKMKFLKQTIEKPFKNASKYEKYFPDSKLLFNDNYFEFIVSNLNQKIFFQTSNKNLIQPKNSAENSPDKYYVLVIVFFLIFIMINRSKINNNT